MLENEMYLKEIIEYYQDLHVIREIYEVVSVTVATNPSGRWI